MDREPPLPVLYTEGRFPPIQEELDHARRRPTPGGVVQNDPSSSPSALHLEGALARVHEDPDEAQSRPPGDGKVQRKDLVESLPFQKGLLGGSVGKDLDNPVPRPSLNRHVQRELPSVLPVEQGPRVGVGQVPDHVEVSLGEAERSHGKVQRHFSAAILFL